MAKKAAKVEAPVEDVVLDEVDFDALLTGVDNGTLTVPETEDEGGLKAAKGEAKAVADPPPVVEEEEEVVEKQVEGKEVEAEEEQEEEGEIDHEARAAALEAIIEQQAAGTSPVPVAEKPTEDEGEGKKPAEVKQQEFVQQPVVDTPIVFFEEQDNDTHRDVQDDPAVYAKQQNDFGNAILSKAQERTIMKLVPMLAKLIPDYFDLKFEQEKFYARNPELGNIRAYTGKVLNEIRQQNPSKSLKEQLELTKVEVYKKLKLPGKQVSNNGNTVQARSTKFAGPGKQARPIIETKEVSTDKTEMDQMMEVVA